MVRSGPLWLDMVGLVRVGLGFVWSGSFRLVWASFVARWPHLVCFGLGSTSCALALSVLGWFILLRSALGLVLLGPFGTRLGCSWQLACLGSDWFSSAVFGLVRFLIRSDACG